MTTIKDPPRLFESLDAPMELRAWLQRAHEDAVPDMVVSELRGRLDARLAAPEPKPAKDAWRKLAEIRLAKGLASALIVLGVGATGTVAVVQRASTRSVSLEALPFKHWNTRLANLNAHLDLSQPQPTLAPLEAASSTVAAHSNTRVISSVQPRRDSTVSAGRAAGERSMNPASSDEYRLLRAARDAVEREPARALSLVAQHARSFPKGMLGQEREAIAINALLRLGRMAEARERGSRFVRAFPGSPHAKRIEAAIKK